MPFQDRDRPTEGYPKGSSSEDHFDLHNSPIKLRVGIIIESIPHVRAYMVQIPGHSPTWAIPADGNSGASFELGVSSFHTFVPGSIVLCAQAEGKTIVIAGVPLSQDDGARTAPLWLFGGSGVGILDSSYQPALQNEGNEIDNSAVGTPADTLVGDWGVSSPFGPHVIVSEFHAALGISAACGVETHVIDELLKLSGYNLDLDTSATGLEIRHNQDENRVLFGASKFPRERLGVVVVGKEPFEKQETQWAAGSHDIKSKYEPVKKDQIPFFRWQEHLGFLGDVKRNFVAIPSPEAEVAHYSDEKRYIGVLEEHYGADGAYHLRSAREIILAKTIPFPVPEAVLPVESPDADEVVEHEDQEDWNWEEFEPDERAGALVDYLAYRFNWYTRANYPAHEKDWRLREESELAEELDMENAYADVDAIEHLRENYRADPPEFTKLEVDARTGELRYGQASSYIELGDDGSITLGDTYGSQIVMAHGHITLTCPGDINFRPGRSSVTWAPKDAIIRAGSNVDISATDEDVRIKAEKDVAVLSGNGGKSGGILLESRAENSIFITEGAGTETSGSGVIIKCPDSSFAVWSKQAHVETYDGPVSIVAANGEQPLTMRASSVLETIDSTHVFLFQGPNDDRARDVHIIGETLATFSNAMIHSDNAILSFGAGIYSTGDVLCAGMVAYGTVVTEVDAAELEEQLDEAKEGIEKAQDGYAEAERDMRKAIEDNESQHPASEEVQEKFGFSMRTDKQYDLGDDFTIVCGTWQRQLEGGEWSESVVVSPIDNIQTYPHPGERWQEEDIFHKPTLDKPQVDEHGIPVERGKGIALGEVKRGEMTPSKGYKTLRRKTGENGDG